MSSYYYWIILYKYDIYNLQYNKSINCQNISSSFFFFFFSSLSSLCCSLFSLLLLVFSSSFEEHNFIVLRWVYTDRTQMTRIVNICQYISAWFKWSRYSGFKFNHCNKYGINPIGCTMLHLERKFNAFNCKIKKSSRRQLRSDCHCWCRQ